MINETYNNSCNDYITKCEVIKIKFLNDCFFDKKINKIDLTSKHYKTIDELFTSFCNCNHDDEILIDFRYFKILEKINGFNTDVVIEYLVKMVQNILKKKEHFFIHVCLQSFTIIDMEKNYGFLRKLIETVNSCIPNISDKLEKCFLYKAPFILSKMLSMLSSFVEKKSLSNIQVVS